MQRAKQEEGINGTAEAAPIIIKKTTSGEGHHGSAWKVAFADFVTALMALFMVLWLTTASQQKKEAIAAYFTDPQGFEEKWGAKHPAVSLDEEELESFADTIESALKKMPELQRLKDQVVATVTGEGLRIELLETEQGSFFKTGSSQPSALGRRTIKMIGNELAKLDNKIIIEGHTDARPFRGADNYTNWELSADRANWARRILIDSGLDPDRIVQVRGFADVNLRKPEAPTDPSNRRITLIVRYREQNRSDSAAPTGPPVQMDTTSPDNRTSPESHEE